MIVQLNRDRIRSATIVTLPSGVAFSKANCSAPAAKNGMGPKWLIDYEREIVSRSVAIAAFVFMMRLWDDSLTRGSKEMKQLRDLDEPSATEFKSQRTGGMPILTASE